MVRQDRIEPRVLAERHEKLRPHRCDLRRLQPLPRAGEQAAGIDDQQVPPCRLRSKPRRPSPATAQPAADRACRRAERGEARAGAAPEGDASRRPDQLLRRVGIQHRAILSRLTQQRAAEAALARIRRAQHQDAAKPVVPDAPDRRGPICRDVDLLRPRRAAHFITRWRPRVPLQRHWRIAPHLAEHALQAKREGLCHIAPVRVRARERRDRLVSSNQTQASNCSRQDRLGVVAPAARSRAGRSRR